MIRTPIDDPYLGRRNAIHRFNLRQIEKNRFPKKCECVVCGEFFQCGNIEDYLKRQYYLGPKNGRIRHVCWACSAENKIKVAAGTLYHLVCAVPVAERDRQEIYPAVFPYPRIPLWHEAKMRMPGLGLRDYAEPTRLLSKFGRHDPVIRQQAASPVRNVLAITSDLVDLPAIERRLALYLWGRLTPPDTQQVLKRIDRLYKNSCWWSKKGPRRVFDKAEALSWKKARLWKPGQYSVDDDFGPKDDRLIEFRELIQTAREGGHVFLGQRGSWNKPFWLRSHKRHANLEGTRASFNDEHGSYWNSPRDNLGRANLTKTFRALSSLNIPRETIDARNAMIANLERDFAPRNEARAA
jgi:hypothetical protein